MGLEYGNQGFLLCPPPCLWQTGASQWESQPSFSLGLLCSLQQLHSACWKEGLAWRCYTRPLGYFCSFYVLCWLCPLTTPVQLPQDCEGFSDSLGRREMSHFFEHVKCTSHGTNLSKLCQRLGIVQGPEGSTVWWTWETFISCR